ncbi:EthD family reductase [Nocardia sp. NPDC051787]|uniref:EthD family reductase n=1 Tax=Nocardia sp. NPDC051787 TaxID=3155415 RepID=UPI003418A6FA
MRFLILYDTPEGPVAFDRHYREVHIPLVRGIPGVRRCIIGRNAVAVRARNCHANIAAAHR